MNAQPRKIFQIYALNLSVPGAQPFPCAAFKRSLKDAQDEVAKLERLAASSTYPMHNHKFTIREVA